MLRLRFGVLLLAALLCTSCEERSRSPGDNGGYRIFTTERDLVASKAVPAVSAWCERTEDYRRDGLLVKGYRLQAVNTLPGKPPRGWDSAIDFYAAREFAGTPDSLLQAIERQMLASRSTAFLEFRAPDGTWKRSSFDPATHRIVTAPVDRSAATYGIVADQLPTEFEDKYTLYGVRIQVVNLASGTVVARHTGFAWDKDWGKHDHALLMPEHCHAGKGNDNIVGEWLLSLTRKPAKGSGVRQ